MGRKTILVDDYTGEELAEDTTPIRLTIGSESYDLYLSGDSVKALNDALDPFVKSAEQVEATGSGKKTDPKTVREWAQKKQLEHNGKPLGDKGPIPQAIHDAYNDAHKK